MKFKSAYSRGESDKTPFSNPGNEIRTTMAWIKNEDGEEELVEDKTYNIAEEIQSYAEDCDIKSIVQRASFDPAFAQSLMQGVIGENVDISNLPNNIHEAKKQAETVPTLKAEVNKIIAEKSTEKTKKEVTTDEPKQ